MLCFKSILHFGKKIPAFQTYPNSKANIMSNEDNNDNQLNTSSVVLNDDSCELVFEYLSLEDKCRLERVSEQFKKLVSNKTN